MCYEKLFSLTMPFILMIENCCPFYRCILKAFDARFDCLSSMKDGDTLHLHICLDKNL
jgi:hypothetical protein